LLVQGDLVALTKKYSELLDDPKLFY